MHECRYAHINTTVISVCNNDERNRTITKAEVRHGITQLIQDCGSAGVFSGTHMANNLSYSAFGITKAKAPRVQPSSHVQNKSGAGFNRHSQSVAALAGEDCAMAYDGVPHTDCQRKNVWKEAERRCEGEWVGCQIYCEIKRTGFYGMERPAPGSVSNMRGVPGTSLSLEKGYEFSVSHAFSATAEGTLKAVFAAGVSYAYSVTQTTGTTVVMSPEAKSDTHWSRWVYFPKLIETCGIIQRRPTRPPPSCTGDICLLTRQADHGCVETVEPETLMDQCSTTPRLNDAGEPSVDWAYRFELKDGNPAPFKEQPPGYQHICTESGNPDGDEETECNSNLPTRSYTEKD